MIGVLGVGGPVDKYLPDQQRYKGIHQNFRMAMAAPANLPEFNGNVAAVFTEQFWDMELVDLRAKEANINQTVKQMFAAGAMSREEQNVTREKLRAETFSPLELMTLQKGVSNQEYHYLGSAKIMAQIGKGFADSMTKLMHLTAE